MRNKYCVSLVNLILVLGVLLRYSNTTQSDSDVVTLINAERAEHSLSPLQRDSCLRSAAERHSQDMADNRFCGHTGSDGCTLADRILAAGYVYHTAAETVACGFGSAESALAAWMASDPHTTALMGSWYDDIGCANARGYWTCVLETGTCTAPPEPTPLQFRVWLPLVRKRG